MKFTRITAYGKPMLIWCDEKCNKAWGVVCRPKKQLSEIDDDIFFIGDKDLPDAPEDPGTYEGGCAKPRNDAQKHNKWCFRQCERCESQESSDTAKFVTTTEADFEYLNQGFYNMPDLESNQKVDKL